MLEFRILGPVEVVRDGRPLPLGGAKQRALLADLSLHANEVLSADRLIDDLWGEEPPETASHLLHVYVSRLRKTLEDDGQAVLVTRTPGYLLRLDPPDELDASRFELEARRGVELLGGRPGEALETLDRALATWRGRALEEFADDPFAQPSVARLEELRQATHERRVEALLALGRQDEALVELEGLIARFPLRERLRELQMLALYRAGRQADALQAFQSARRTLADELGVDPGSALVGLEEAILRHDPELEAPAREPEAPEPPPHGPEPPPVAPRGRGSARSRAVAVVGVVGVVGAVAIVVAVVASLGRPAPVPLGEPDGSPSASPPAEGVTPVLALSWAEVPDPAGIFAGPGNQVLHGGVAAPDGIVAVGHSTGSITAEAGPDLDAAVWIGSPSDGWTRADEAAFAAPGNQEATDAVLLPKRIVVVGSDASGGDHDAAVWTLEDGATTWSRVDPDAPGMREVGDQWVRGIAWTGTRAIAVGLSRIDGDDDAAVWVSRDGRHWTLLVPGNLAAPGNQQMIAVTRFRRRVVAAGFGGTGEGRDAAVWLSRDGIEWEPVPSDALGGDGDQQINSLTALGTMLVAVGEDTIGEDGDAAVWVSSDGRHWTRVADPTGALGGPGSQQMSSVASSEGLLVAGGTEIVGNEVNAAIWTSSDGTTWTRSPSTTPGMSSLVDYGRQWIRALLATEDGFVALGREGRGRDDDADIWIGQPVA